MNELISRLSSYNVFNYLFPGVLLAIGGTYLTAYSLRTEDIIIDGFIFYFYGLTVSRVGSLVLEPALSRFDIIHHNEYNDFIQASEADKMVLVMSEVANMYRTLAALFFCLCGLFSVNVATVESSRSTFESAGTLLGLAMLGVIFMVSWVKQNWYVHQRIEREIRNTNTGACRSGTMKGEQ